MEKHLIEIDNYQFIYYVVRSKRRTMVLNFDESGHFIVHTNNYMPISKIEEFIKDKIEVILKKQAKVLKQHYIQYSGISDEKFYYLGEAYDLVLVKSNNYDVKFKDRQMLVYYEEYEKIERTILNFMKKETLRLSKISLNNYAKILEDYHLSEPELSVRFNKTRWGSCTPAKNSIRMNAYLIHYPLGFLESVVIHELAHLVQPNHSKKFYQVIEYYEPEYKEKHQLVSKI